MTETAEQALLDAVRQALVSVHAIGDPDQLTDYAAAVVEQIKLDDWLITRRGVHGVIEYSWNDGSDEYEDYTVYTTPEPLEDE